MRVLLLALLLFASAAASAAALSVKGVSLGAGHEICQGGAIDEFDTVGAELRAELGAKDWRPTGITSCELPMETFASKPVKGSKVYLHFLRGKLVLARFDMDPMSETEVLEFMRALGAAYGSWTDSKANGRFRYRWASGAARLTAARDVVEDDSLYRLDVRLEAPADVSAMDRAMQRTLAIQKRLNNQLKNSLARIQAQDAK